MEYYTNKNKLILTEYGRNIQLMVEHAMTIKDKKERTHCVNTIINIMGNLFPHLRDVNDFKHKLWDHLACMSNYELDIDYPYEILRSDNSNTKPEKLPYPSNYIKNRHYGRTLERFIQATADINHPEKDSRYVPMIANHMKKCFLTWNKEVVDDKKILDDLHNISNGYINLQEQDIKLKESKEILAARNKSKLNNNNNGKKNNNNNNNSKK